MIFHQIAWGKIASFFFLKMSIVNCLLTIASYCQKGTPDSKWEATNTTETEAYTGGMSYMGLTEMSKVLSRRHLCVIL
jgi:hypothetical protein